MSEMLRAALAADAATGQPAPPTFTVRVEPNLVPGDTFTVTLDVHPPNEPTPEPGDRHTHPTR